MRVLILGGDGMLGHQLRTVLSPRHDVHATLRAAATRDGGKVIGGVDVRETDRLETVLGQVRPEAVINAVGIVKQRPTAAEAIPSLEINSLFPHRLALLCRAAGARMIHVSTDCVFSGHGGGYRESDEPDPLDLYGRSKLLGEVTEPHCVTLRTSIIGLELRNHTGLVEWFLASSGTVKGFEKAIYSGLTTAELARVMDRILTRHPDLSGLWHVASEPISKYDLLRRLATALGRDDIEVVADDALVCDRSLEATRFNQAAGYAPPDWTDMIDELAGEVRARA